MKIGYSERASEATTSVAEVYGGRNAVGARRSLTDFLGICKSGPHSWLGTGWRQVTDAIRIGVSPGTQWLATKNRMATNSALKTATLPCRRINWVVGNIQS